LGGCIHLKKAPDARNESQVPVLQTWAKLDQQNGGAVQDNWVSTFDDSVLDALIAEALEHNRDIQAAAARHDQAIALAKRAGADFWPSVNLLAGGSVGSNGRGQGSSNVNISAAASWELDLWGRVRYLTHAAVADAQAAEADLEFARQSIAAQTAETYYLAIANRLHLANSLSQSKIQEEIDRIQQAKLKEGQVGVFESQLSKSDLARFRADVQDRQSKYEEALRALEVLLGRFPAAEINAADRLPDLPGAVPAGLPSELLERRPDIISAERAVASAFFQTQSARMNLLPRIALTGNGGLASTNLYDLFEGRNAFFNVGGNLFQPLFDAGARFADIEALKALQRQTLATYAQSALNAFLDVQNGLANEAYFRERLAQARQASASMDVVLPIAQQQYNAGTLSLLNFKQVQTQAYDTKDDYIDAAFGQVQQRIRLHQALGGGINTGPRPATTRPATQPATMPGIAPATQPLSR
jgi:NodT family efflux transporter outer membrane factor (OMF) lipoprotein